MASQRDIARETNARFWIMTSYKPGEALDPADLTDRRMARIWLDINRDLTRQNRLGTLALTHQHPSLAQRLNDAIAAYRVQRTLREDDPRYAEARDAKTQALNEAALWQETLVASRGPLAVSGSWGVR